MVCPPVARPGSHPGASQQEAPLEYSKTPFAELDAPRKIRSVKFSLMSPTEIGKCGVFHVFERNLYQMPQRVPLPNGILDPRMGTTDKKGAECATCKGKLIDCAGHFGYVKLEMPVFHIGYFKNVIAILQQVCKTCSRVMVPEEEKQQYLRRFRSPRLEIVPRRALSKKLAEKCKRCRSCPHCGAANGVVKRAGASLKIVHEKYSKNPEFMEQYMGEFEEAAKHNEQLRANLGRVQDDLNPIARWGVLSQDLARGLRAAGRRGPAGAPDFDAPARAAGVHPPQRGDGRRRRVQRGRRDDEADPDHRGEQRAAAGLGEGPGHHEPDGELGLPADPVRHVHQLELPGLSLQYQGPGKPLRGFVQRLKGKQGRFRGNLSGKRVDFSGRTVISPDPNLRIDEVGVPLHIAKNMTYPEVVSRHNIEKIRECVRNGMNQHPGANFVRFKNGGTQYLKYGDRRKVAAELKMGDTVERHLRDGDVLLFNRQPSLHKMSIMAHRARVMPWRTLRFNECVCTPYNADFDGDEMNIHCPQTEEARAEAIELMSVHNNLCTPKNGEILVAATQDFITASYLLTSRDTFLDRAMVGQLVAMMGDALLSVDLPTPAIVAPVELWTGKQLFSVLIRPGLGPDIRQPGGAEKKYTKPRPGAEAHVPQRRVRVHPELGDHLRAARQGDAGQRQQERFVYVLNSSTAPRRGVGDEPGGEALARWLGHRGFSVGIDDVTPGHVLQTEKAQGGGPRVRRLRQERIAATRGTLQHRQGATPSRRWRRR